MRCFTIFCIFYSDFCHTHKNCFVTLIFIQVIEKVYYCCKLVFLTLYLKNFILLLVFQDCSLLFYGYFVIQRFSSLHMLMIWTCSHSVLILTIRF